jgi:hypothetical protein
VLNYFQVQEVLASGRCYVKMRTREEIEKMFADTKKELDEILDGERTGDKLREDRRLILSAQLGILSWTLGSTEDETEV